MSREILRNNTKGENDMPRIRSIRETAKILKEMDPNTELTEATIRKMIAEGTIPALKTGTKYLINVDLVIDMFGSATTGKLKTSPVFFDPVINK